jgi:hypothetical protein
MIFCYGFKIYWQIPPESILNDDTSYDPLPGEHSGEEVAATSASGRPSSQAGFYVSCLVCM